MSPEFRKKDVVRAINQHIDRKNQQRRHKEWPKRSVENQWKTTGSIHYSFFNSTKQIHVWKLNETTYGKIAHGVLDLCQYSMVLSWLTRINLSSLPVVFILPLYWKWVRNWNWRRWTKAIEAFYSKTAVYHLQTEPAYSSLHKLYQSARFLLE